MSAIRLILTRACLWLAALLHPLAPERRRIGRLLGKPLKTTRTRRTPSST